jgi:hypothetical protein
MNTNDRHPIDQATAIAFKRAAHSSTGVSRLDEQLRWAASPARAGELVGEEQAVAAFRTAVLVPTAQTRRPSMIKATIAKFLTLKAAAVLAAVSVGGVALAASTGVIPSPLSEDPPAPAHSVTAPPANPGAGDPSPSLQGLCQAYLAGAGSEHGRALESPAFQALVTAAGGAQSVDAYCATLAPANAGSTTPDHPTGAPTDHPTGPTGTPGAHPTGRPTELPTPAVTGTPEHP